LDFTHVLKGKILF